MAETSAISRAVQAEIERKASKGEPLSNTSNAANNAAYASAVAANKVKATPITAPNAAPIAVTPDNIMGKLNAQSATDMTAINEFLQKGSAAYVDSQKALLGQARDKQLADITATYEQAVNEGTISVRDAETQLAKAKEEINQQAYQNSQSTAISADDMGIQNSMQFMALQQGNQVAANKATNAKLSERDQRIFEIKNRLAGLKATSDRDTSMANANYGYGVANAQGTADQQYNGKVADYMQQNATVNREQGFQFGIAELQQAYAQANLTTQQKNALEQMAKQQGYDLTKMNTQQGFDVKNAATQQGYTEKNMATTQKYTLEQFAKQFGYDMSKMSASQQNDLAKMAVQNGYNISSDARSLANSKSLQASGAIANAQAATAEQKARDAAELKAYDLSVARELKKYTPGTSEYSIRSGQLATEREGMIAEMATKTQFEATSADILANPVTKPVLKTYSPMEQAAMKTTMSKKKIEAKKQANLDDYNTKMKAYQRYLDFKADPSSAFKK